MGQFVGRAMARKVERLKPLAVEKLKKPGMYPDGKGLYLRITDSGAKSWIFRFMLSGRAREMGLGGYNRQSNALADAREAVAEYHKLLRAGTDPIEHKKAQTAARNLEDARSKTFDQCAADYIQAHRAGWSNEKHAKQWENTLATYASPTLGKLAVQDIDISLILRVLEPIWKTKTETATRVRGRIESVLDWATVRGYRQGENPARWKGYLNKALPKPNKVRTIQHHPALPYEDIPKFMPELAGHKGVSARALEFTILTASRTGEVLPAKWDEFDLTKKIWTVPKERMKAREEHRVPLATRALAILSELEKTATSEYVFPSTRYNRHLSKMAMSSVVKRMGRKGITVHGFRSTFRDWVAERTNAPNQVAEAALAHSIGNRVEAAYRRRDLLAKRAKLMEDWSRYTESKKADVLPMKKEKSA